MARVLVTGANGHLGANTVQSLLARGHEVAPMVRLTSDLRGLDGLGLTYRYADVLDADSVLTAAQGCDVIVHSAAVYAVWAKDPDEIVAPSVTGTRNVFAAAEAAGVQRIVYTSSIAAVGYSDAPDNIRTAADWNEDARNPYYTAKVRGEQEAVRLSDESGIDTIRLCPAMVMGPWDFRITPSMGPLALDLINGNGSTWKGGANLVHAFDAGEAHARAVDQGEPGGRYIVGGENVDMVRVGELVEKWTGVRPRHLGVSRGAGMAMGSVLEAVAKITGKEPQFTRSVAYEHAHRYAYFDCDETNRVFGLAPKGADEMMRDAIRWLLFIGKIKRALPASVIESLPPDPTWTVG